MFLFSFSIRSLFLRYSLVCIPIIGLCIASCIMCTGQRTDLRTPAGVIDCPQLCRCWCLITTQSLSVDCSSNNLKIFPQNLPVNTAELNLDDNIITSLTSSNLAGCPQLKILRIRRNLLSEINNKTFSSVTSLEELYLNDNKLILNDSKSIAVFSKLTNLRVLSIQNNLAFTDDVLQGLVKLSALSVDRKNIVTFGPAFYSLVNLESLSIYGSMKNLSNETFKDLWNCTLKELNIKTKNTLSTLEPLTFAPLTHLEKLDLSYNRGLGFDNVAKAWYGLQFTNISSLILSRIIADTEVGPTLTARFYKDLELSKITSFVISKNNIVAIESGMSAALSLARHVDFSYNRLSNIGTLVLELGLMRHLINVDFSYQSKRYLNKRDLASEGITSEKDGIVNTNLSGISFSNKSSEMCEVGAWKPCTFTLGMSQSKHLQEIPLPDFGPWCVMLPSRLETANLSATVNVQLPQFPQVLLLGSYRHFRRLVYRANGFSRAVGPLVVHNCNKSLPMTFDLGENGMTCIAADFMKIMIQNGCNIGGLILSNNDLGGQLEKDIDGRVFRLYRNLTELNLAKNSIKSLPYNIFGQLQVLENLNLSENFLRKVEFEFTHFQRMNIIDISNNLLTSLNADVLENFQKLFVLSNMTVDLSANPIQCACETLQFLRWIDQHQLNMVSFQRISCLYHDKLITFDKLKTVILTELEFQCSSNLILKISAGLLGFGVLIVAVSIFLYRHRWDIRYYFLNLTTNRHQYQLLSEREHEYEYDAFVSYDHRDFHWVHKELMKHIENSIRDEPLSNNSENCLNVRRIQLCIHGRDFTPGDAIAENILTAIKTSRNVILVVTKNFLRSEWCKFELEIAQMESIDRGRNIIIPVLLTSVNLKDMPSVLQSLVRRNTYLEWEEDSSDKTEFWKSLRKALSDTVIEPSTCERGRPLYTCSSNNCDEGNHGAACNVPEM